MTVSITSESLLHLRDEGNYYIGVPPSKERETVGARVRWSVANYSHFMFQPTIRGATPLFLPPPAFLTLSV